MKMLSKVYGLRSVYVCASSGVHEKPVLQSFLKWGKLVSNDMLSVMNVSGQMLTHSLKMKLALF